MKLGANDDLTVGRHTKSGRPYCCIDASYDITVEEALWLRLADAHFMSRRRDAT